MGPVRAPEGSFGGRMLAPPAVAVGAEDCTCGGGSRLARTGCRWVFYDKTRSKTRGARGYAGEGGRACGTISEVSATDEGERRRASRHDQTRALILGGRRTQLE